MRKRLWRAHAAAIAAVLVAGTLTSVVVVGATPAAARSAQTAQIKVDPTSGPPGTTVLVSGRRFGPCTSVRLTFEDANGRSFVLGTVIVSQGHFVSRATIPIEAGQGDGTIEAFGGRTCPIGATTAFIVT